MPRSTSHVFWFLLSVFILFLAGPAVIIPVCLWVWRASANAKHNARLEAEWKGKMLERVTNAYKFPLDKRGD